MTQRSPQNPVRTLGTWRRARILGGVNTPALPLIDRARCVTRAIPQAVACRRTAAHIWGVDPLASATPATGRPVEIIAPGPLTIPGCLIHVMSVPSGDVTEHVGVRLTTPDRTAFDCARWSPRLEAVTMIDQFLRRGVDLDDLLHRPTDSRRVRDILALADRRAASPRESWLRVILIDGGLPRPTAQLRVPLPGGRNVYLDLGWEPYKVAVEYDGRAHHARPADQRRDDLRRQELNRLGRRVIVVGRDVIPARTAEFLEHVAGALIERGWQPGPDGMIHILSRVRAARRFRPRPRRLRSFDP